MSHRRRGYASSSRDDFDLSGSESTDGCHRVEVFRPCLPGARPPPSGCCPCRRLTVAYCCHSCKHEGRLELRVPIQPVVGVVAQLTAPVALTLGVPTTISYNAVVAGAQFYNAGTGVTTLPVCADGFYTLSAHTTITSASVIGSATIAILANGITLTQTTLTALLGQSVDGDLTISFPLSSGQSVTVTATATVGSVSLAVAATNFSLVLVSGTQF